MADLIDRKKLLTRIEDSWNSAGLHGEDYRKIKKWLRCAPTFEAEKHGRWIDVNEYHIGTCSACKNRWGSVDEMHYCPNCGARMDEGEKKNED